MSPDPHHPPTSSKQTTSNSPPSPPYQFETIAVHGGYYQVEPSSRSRVVPLYQTSSYTFDNDAYAADLFALRKPGNIYTRLQNPTTAVLEDRLALLEGGVGALALSSGQGAETVALMTLLQSGDSIVSSAEIYGGTYTLMNYTLRKFGISPDFVDIQDLEALNRSIATSTKAVYLESLSNPSLRVPNMEAIAKIAHDHGIPLIVDNTIPSPYLCNPIQWGADIVIHSTTKYISGHGFAIGGAIVDAGTFDWGTSPKFKHFHAPDASYHGLNFGQSFGKSAFITKCRVQGLRDLGAAPSPFNSWLTLVGFETLPLRMEKTCQNAEAIASYLAQHRDVAWVNYPTLRGKEDRARSDKYFPRGYSGILGFGVKGGYEAAKKFINSTKLISHLANIGDAKTLVIHPASTTHQQLNEDELKNAGISPDFIRLSVGIENTEDIIHDLDQAIKEAVSK